MGVVLQQFVARLVKKAFKRIHLDFQQWTRVHITAPVNAHIACGTCGIGGLVVFELVSKDAGPGFAQNGLPLKGGIQVWPPCNVVCFKEYNPIGAL
jgi:hypothetical protein